jgi:hypothetical protein
MKKAWIIVLVFAGLGIRISAQEKPVVTVEVERMAAYQAANAVNEHHEFFKKFVGDWAVQMTFWTAPGKPPVTSRAAAKSEVRFGDRFLFILFTGEMMGKPYEGQEIIGYDNLEKMYNIFYMDNTSTHVYVAKGVQEGDVLSETGESTDPLTGKKSAVHARTTFLGKDEYLYEQFMVQDDGNEIKMLELRCLRKK